MPLSVMPKGNPNCLLGMAFVVTGVLPTLSRDDAQKLIEQYGGLFRKSVSGKTTYLVTGSILEDGRPYTEGSKYKAAQKKKVKILDQDGFLTLIGQAPSQNT